MKTIKAIIIDDVKNARVALKESLQMYCDEVTVVAEANGVETGLMAIRNHEPELVFLDVEMQDGTGFDLLEQLQTIDFKLIFTTAFMGYAIRALRMSAVDYLLKPIDSGELQTAIARVKTLSSDITAQLRVLLDNNLNGSSKKDKMVIHTSDGMHILALKEVFRLESEGNYTHVHVSGRKPLVTAKTLKYFEDLLGQDSFKRVHHSHLVNLEAIKQYVNRDGGYLLLHDESHIPVAQRKKTELLSLLNQL